MYVFLEKEMFPCVHIVTKGVDVMAFRNTMNRGAIHEIRMDLTKDIVKSQVPAVAGTNISNHNGIGKDIITGQSSQYISGHQIDVVMNSRWK